MLGLRLHAGSGRDLQNMFLAGLKEHFVRTRNEMADIRAWVYAPLYVRVEDGDGKCMPLPLSRFIQPLYVPGDTE